MVRKLKFMSYLLVFMFCLSGLAFGQDLTGNIVGTIKDTNGGVVPGMSVQITGISIGFNRTITADADGTYAFRDLPPGNYKVTTSADKGFAATSGVVTVALGKSSTLDITVQASGTTADVTVTTGEVGATLDTSTSAVQTNINSRTAELLPKGTNFNSILRLSPSTRAETRSGGFQVDGASGSENSFVIDGQEVANFRTGTLNGNNNVPNQFVGEVQIKTSGFNAEFGGATGAVVSIVTKGGTNDFHGQFGIDFETSKLQAGPRSFLARRTNVPSGTATIAQVAQYFRPARDQYLNVYPSATLGGRIIKDRLWFFGSYTPQFQTVTRNTTYFNQATLAQTNFQTYKREQRNEYGFIRLDAAPINSLRVTGSYTWNPIIVDGNLPVGTNGSIVNGINVGAGGISLGGAPPSVNFGGTLGTLTGRQLTDIQGGRQNANNVATSATWTPTSKMTVSGRYSRGFLNERIAAYAIPPITRFICADNQTGASTPGGPVTAADAGCATGFQNITTNSQVFFDVSLRTNFEGDVSYYVSNFVGRHQFKGGYQNTKIANSVSRGYRPFGIVQLFYGYTFADLEVPGNPTNAADSVGVGTVTRFATEGTASNRAQSIYFQDSWQPTSRLTLNLGVRAEKENLPSFNSFSPPINFNYGDKVVPRLGAAYDLFGDGKTKIFGTYAQFVDRLRFDLPRGSFGGDFFRVDSFDITRSRGVRFDTYTLARILGNNQDQVGGRCPINNASGFTICQQDFRIASNNPTATVFDGKVDPDLKPFRQEEITVGVEREFAGKYLFTGRYVRKKVKDAVEDAGFPTAAGSEAYIIGNPGSGLHLATAQQFGYAKVAKPERQYDAMQLTLERRLSGNYYYNVNYTYSRLYGNYSGLASSDENGRTSPGVNRFFDLPFIGYNVSGQPDNGRLATDRPHVFNAYGAYIYDWFGKKLNSTEIGFFTNVQSGTPETTFVNLYSALTILNKRGDLGRTPTFSQTDMSLSHSYRFGTNENYKMVFAVNVDNLFNQATVTSFFNTISAPNINAGNAALGVADEPAGINKLLRTGVLSEINTFLAGTNRTDVRYKMPSGFQTGRFVRFGFRFQF